MERLLSYDWPGNIRELMNLIERIFIDPPQDKITIADLPESMRSGPSVRQETVPRRARNRALYLVSDELEQEQSCRATTLVPDDALSEDCEVPHSGEPPGRNRSRC